MIVLFPVLAFVSLAVMPASAESPALRQLQNAAGVAHDAVGRSSPEASSSRAGSAFEPIDETIFQPETEEAPPARLEPARKDLVVGRPQRLSEPKNPVTEDGKAKSKGGGWLWKLVTALVIGAVCAGIGFLVGGFVGAAIGGAVGAIGGWGAAP